MNCFSGAFTINLRRVYLVHTRLAILDLSATGRQPMQGPGGRYTIVFNGEIYDFHDVRHSIESVALAWMFGDTVERPARAATLGRTPTVVHPQWPEEPRAQ